MHLVAERLEARRVLRREWVHVHERVHRRIHPCGRVGREGAQERELRESATRTSKLSHRPCVSFARVSALHGATKTTSAQRRSYGKYTGVPRCAGRGRLPSPRRPIRPRRATPWRAARPQNRPTHPPHSSARPAHARQMYVRAYRAHRQRLHRKSAAPPHWPLRARERARTRADPRQCSGP